VARHDQYEIWEFNGGRWEFVASFPDFDVAHTMARKRSYRARLVHVRYEEGKRMGEEILSEIGATRRREEAS